VLILPSPIDARVTTLTTIMARAIGIKDHMTRSMMKGHKEQSKSKETKKFIIRLPRKIAFN
jgi:hypothetical protein